MKPKSRRRAAASGRPDARGAACLSSRRRPRWRDEDRDLQHQQRQQAAARTFSPGCGGAARRGLPAGAEDRTRISQPPRSRRAGYGAVWRGQRAWNGVAILARGASRSDPSELPGDPADTQPRYIEAAVNGSSSPPLRAERQPAARPEVRLQARLDGAAPPRMPATSTKQACRWCWPATTMSPEPGDVYPTKSYDKERADPAQSRAATPGCSTQGWTDALRTTASGRAPLYTFWDYRRMRWEREGGHAPRPPAAECGCRAAARGGGRRPRCARARRRTRATTRRPG